MDERNEWVVQQEEAGNRLDIFVTLMMPEVTRSRVQKLLSEGKLTVDGKEVKAGYKLRQGESVVLILPEAVELNADPEPMDIPILYEDEDIAVVNKRRGLVVHPSAGHEAHTLVNGLMYTFQGRLSDIGGVLRPGIVHRIDKDTSGLLMVCKSDRAHRIISERLKDHDIERVYHAVVHGRMKDPQGTIDQPIGRMTEDRKKMTVRPDGRRAITHYRVLEEFRNFSYLEITLETGRTHQIRVHMKSLGHPVLGDPLYGPAKQSTPEGRFFEKQDFWPGQILHAKVLGFEHPVTKEHLHFDSQLPDYFQFVLEELRRRER